MNQCQCTNCERLNEAREARRQEEIRRNEEKEKKYRRHMNKMNRLAMKVLDEYIDQHGDDDVAQQVYSDIRNAMLDL